MKIIIHTLLLLLFRSALAADYYRPRDYGSDAFYDPLSTFVLYSTDTLQVHENFSTGNFRQNLNSVFDQLRHPRRAIDSEGGFKRFVNRQIFPIDRDHQDDSYSMLPNYALHLFGGGMVYRRDLEWLRDHEYEYDTSLAITLAMTSEVVQEAFERETTLNDDAVADVLLFRPIGIWLFHNDAFAQAFMETMNPAIWPSLLAFDPNRDQFVNAGLNYIYRPPALDWGMQRLFIFTGINNLIGLSHALDAQDYLSWGVGAAVQSIDPVSPQQSELDASFGLFYDREDSLLWALIINDTGGDHVRLNIYPDGKSWRRHLGIFVQRGADDAWSLGILYRFGVGLATQM